MSGQDDLVRKISDMIAQALTKMSRSQIEQMLSALDKLPTMLTRVTTMPSPETSVLDGFELIGSAPLWFRCSCGEALVLNIQEGLDRAACPLCGRSITWYVRVADGDNKFEAAGRNLMQLVWPLLRSRQLEKLLPVVARLLQDETLKALVSALREHGQVGRA